MALLRGWLFAFAVVSTCSLARAADWSIEDGAAQGFANAEWSALTSGDDLSKNVLLRSDARLRLQRGGDALILGPNGEMKLEADGLVRVFKGALSATFEPTPTPLLVMTTYAEIATRGATLGVVAEPYGATVAVRQGTVEIRELTTRDTVQLNAGEVLHVRAGRIGAPEAAAFDEPAMAAADGAPGDAQILPSPVRNRVVSRMDALDLVPTGAIGPPERADARPPETQRVPDRAGRADDPLSAALAARSRRMVTEEPEAKIAPWDSRFQWTQIEDGEVRLKPLLQVISELDKAQTATFWVAVLLLALVWGAVAARTSEGEEPNLPYNAALTALALAVAVWLRDSYLRDHVAAEPFMTMALLLGAPLLALRGAGLVQQLFVAGPQVPARTIHTAPVRGTVMSSTYVASASATAARTEATTEGD